MECEYFSEVFNRQVSLNPNNAQLEKQMVCKLMGLNTNCPSVRFNTLRTWAEYFPKLKFTGSSLPTYFHGLFKRAREFKPKLNYSENYVQTSGIGLMAGISLKGTQYIALNESDYNFLMFNSSRFRIDCGWGPKALASLFSGFSSFNLTFFSSAGSSPSTLRYRVDTSEVNSGSFSIQNG